MAVTKVVAILSRAQALLVDDATHWLLAELQNWLNDAYREIVILKPSANTLVGSFACAAGTKQNLTTVFPNSIRLIDIPRNLTGTKRSVRLISRRVLDDQRPNWHSETGTNDVQHYIFDDRLPTYFWVYPPALATAQLEVAYAAVPASHALSDVELANPATAEVINLDDSYVNAILDYIMYRAFSKDATYANNGQRALMYYQAMARSLGVKIQVDRSESPKAAQGVAP